MFQKLSYNFDVAFSAAVFRGLQILLFPLSNLAQCSSSYRPTSTWPFTDALFRGFQQLLFELYN